MRGDDVQPEFGSSQKIAFADQPNEVAFVVDHGQAAHMLVQHDPGHPFDAVVR